MRALTAVLSLCPETLAQEREWQGRAARASWAVGRVDCTICIARRTLACQTGRLRSADPTNRFPHGLTDQRLAQSTPRGGADPAGGVMWPVRGREARPASGRGAPARYPSHPCWRPRSPPRSNSCCGTSAQARASEAGGAAGRWPGARAGRRRTGTPPPRPCRHSFELGGRRWRLLRGPRRLFIRGPRPKTRCRPARARGKHCPRRARQARRARRRRARRGRACRLDGRIGAPRGSRAGP